MSLQKSIDKGARRGGGVESKNRKEKKKKNGLKVLEFV
jgi:hypothetical protein